MRLGIRTLNPLVWIAEALGFIPTPLLVTFWGMESSRALVAAVELGIVSELRKSPRTAADLARDLSLDEYGTETLLNALNGFGYVKRRGGRYALRSSTRRWFAPDARVDLTRSFGLLRTLWDELGDLEVRVRDGNARDFHRADRDPAFWRRYELGLAAAAGLTAPTIARSVPLGRDPGRLLDVGGGHASFSAAFCRRYPGLEAVVLDLPPAAAIGRELAAEQGLDDRISFREGDLRSTDWGEGYDVVLIFNLLHVLSDSDATDAMRRAYDALAPSGTLAILDAVHSEKNGDVGIVGGGSELLFYAINSTRAYPEATMVEWVREAGFSDVRTKHLLAMPEALITARKPW